MNAVSTGRGWVAVEEKAAPTAAQKGLAAGRTCSIMSNMVSSVKETERAKGWLTLSNIITTSRNRAFFSSCENLVLVGVKTETGKVTLRTVCGGVQDVRDTVN